MTTVRTDLAILGGGLSGCLVALAMRKRRPNLDIVIIDEENRLGGNHIWSFFGSDIADADMWLVAPLVCHGWRGYDVRFPDLERRLSTSYYTILSERLDEHVREQLDPDQLLLGTRVRTASQRGAVLADGTRIEAKAVLDARGGGNVRHLECGWQTFVGRLLHCAEPHGLDRPVIMDATVEQHGAYRFFYSLPFSPTEVFVEDTYYADTPDLDEDVVADRIRTYAGRQGWQVEHESRHERGALPVVWDGDFDGYWRSGGEKLAKAGTRAALFHPITGYSLPDAVRFAMQLTKMTRLEGRILSDSTEHYAREHWKARGFYRMLANLLFNAAEPEKRYLTLQHTYGLSEDVIARFYAGRTSAADKLKILAGKPPVPVHRALLAMAGVKRKKESAQ